MSEVRRLLLKAIDGRKQATVDCSLVLSMIYHIDALQAKVSALIAAGDALCGPSEKPFKRKAWSDAKGKE